MLKNNWNFAFLLPYESNIVYYEKLLDLPNPVQDTTISVKGWGDLTLAADYIHYIYNFKARHTFRPGIAITAPTGQSRQIANGEQLYVPILSCHQFTFQNNWILVPNLGGYFEHSANDTWEGEKQALTGGDVIFAQAGTDLNIKDWTLSFVWQTPLSQSLNGNQILHKNRLSIGVIKSFKL